MSGTIRGLIRIANGHPDVSDKTYANWLKNAAGWGKEDARAGLDNCSLSGWGEEACALYNAAYKKQTLINLITGENDGKNETD